MNHTRFTVGIALGLMPLAYAAKPVSDIQTPDARRGVVERATHVATTTNREPLPEDLGSPFNPPGFDAGAGTPREAGADVHAVSAKAAGPAAPVADRDLLAAVAAKIPTTGTIILGGKPLLISGTNRIEAGSHFTVVYNGQEYELELVAIDRTTFTVRYKGEEFTRSIKQGKTP